MKKMAVLLLLSVFSGIGCGKQALGFSSQRNQAGTRSVVLPGGGSGEAAPEDQVLSSAESAAPPAPRPAVPETGPLEIKEKMFIAQTNDIYLNAEDYLGRTVKLEGLFKTTRYEDMDRTYCFVLRYGPGCCGNDGSAGFEVAWETPEKDYPAEDDWVEAVGVLDNYEEDGYPYLYLALSSLTVKQERGAEFVSQ
jgi:uncharacterized membrane protein YcgQ (UPF0703/DUF1980 family)